MTRKTNKEDRPGWRYYEARRKVQDLIDGIILESFATCRDASLMIKDQLLHERFCDLREAAGRLEQILHQRENAEIQKGRSRKA